MEKRTGGHFLGQRAGVREQWLAPLAPAQEDAGAAARALREGPRGRDYPSRYLTLPARRS
jgi:hypothetical protein